MKKITQEEFNALPFENGVRQCPGFTDYSLIEIFGNGCSFGEGCSFGRSCSFGELCSFGERCSFGDACSFENGHEQRTTNPFVRINNIGSRTDGCTIYDFTDGVYVRCGCFFGTKDEFLKAVETKHADGIHALVYKMAIEMAVESFQLSNKQEGEVLR